MLARTLLNPNHHSSKMMNWGKYWNFFLWMTWYDSAMIMSWPRKMKWKNVPWIIIYGEDDWTYYGTSVYGAKSKVLEGEVLEVGVDWLEAVGVKKWENVASWRTLLGCSSPLNGNCSIIGFSSIPNCCCWCSIATVYCFSWIWPSIFHPSKHNIMWVNLS